MTESFLLAVGIGLAGAGHCLGMCGGIAAALSFRRAPSASLTASYHSGRIVSYAALGALAGGAAGAIDLAPWTISLRILAGVLMILMGFSIAGLWQAVKVLERAGAKLWKPIQKMGASLIPIQKNYQALLLGGCWGLMPCGLIYSALAWSATAANAIESALLMAAFGIGTLPAMVSASIGVGHIQQLLRSLQFRRTVGILLIFAGSWSLYQLISHAPHLLNAPSDHSSHHH